MYQLDKEFLNQIGLSDLPENAHQDFLEQVQYELEFRIADKLTENLNDTDLAQFEVLSSRDDSDAVKNWLEQRCPDYAAIVDAEFNSLKQELIDGKDQILSIAKQDSV